MEIKQAVEELIFRAEEKEARSKILQHQADILRERASMLSKGESLPASRAARAAHAVRVEGVIGPREKIGTSPSGVIGARIE